MISIVPAQKSDIQTLQNLNDEVFTDNYKYDSDLKMDWAQSETGKKYFTELVENPKAICFIAKDGEKAVGYIACSSKDFGYRKGKYIEIENMGVSPSYRSQGIGSLLIDKALGLAKERGFNKVYVNAYSENLKAVEFYEKSGFKKIDISLEKEI